MKYPNFPMVMFSLYYFYLTHLLTRKSMRSYWNLITKSSLSLSDFSYVLFLLFCCTFPIFFWKIFSSLVSCRETNIKLTGYSMFLSWRLLASSRSASQNINVTGCTVKTKRHCLLWDRKYIWSTGWLTLSKNVQSRWQGIKVLSSLLFLWDANWVCYPAGKVGKQVSQVWYIR